jgi:hypothetical protein
VPSWRKVVWSCVSALKKFAPVRVRLTFFPTSILTPSDSFKVSSTCGMPDTSSFSWRRWPYSGRRFRSSWSGYTGCAPCPSDLAQRISSGRRYLGEVSNCGQGGRRARVRHFWTNNGRHRCVGWGKNC